MKVDLGEVIRVKSPSLYKLLPNFVIALLEKIIKQRQINSVLEHCAQKQGQEFLNSALDFMEISRQFVGIEKLDRAKKYIYASNHPLGGLDGLVLLEGLTSPQREVKAVVNDLLSAVEPLRSKFIFVDKFGRQSADRLRAMNEDLNGELDVIFFPAGLCSRRIGKEVTDLKWQKSFVTKAIEHKREIVPLFVENKNSSLFYNFALLREKLGIKANLEMILLPREMFRRANRNIKVIVGEPIPYEQLISNEITPQQWCEEVRRRCYELPKAKNEEI